MASPLPCDSTSSYVQLVVGNPAEGALSWGGAHSFLARRTLTCLSFRRRFAPCLLRSCHIFRSPSSCSSCTASSRFRPTLTPPMYWTASSSGNDLKSELCVKPAQCRELRRFTPSACPPHWLTQPNSPRRHLPCLPAPAHYMLPCMRSFTSASPTCFEMEHELCRLGRQHCQQCAK